MVLLARTLTSLDSSGSIRSDWQRPVGPALTRVLLAGILTSLYTSGCKVALAVGVCHRSKTIHTLTALAIITELSGRGAGS